MTQPTGDRLDSWKEIASYLGRSVRTARRWETEEGLPVRRHMHRSQASVYAYSGEIDAWRLRRDQGPEPAQLRTKSAEAVAAPTEADDSVAVLPFGYLGPDAGEQYLADGFTEEVIGGLSKIRRLRVISRTSSMALKGTEEDAGSLGRRLQVRYLLEGTVRQAGPSLRVSARLIDPQSDDRLWSDTFDGTLDGVFAIQEQIARRIVEALELRLTAEEDRNLSDRPIDDVVAWRCALEARQEALRWRPDAIDRAVQLLENGLAVVGDSPQLYATLGRVHLQYREAGLDLSDRPLVAAERLARRVFELDPGSPAGFQLRGWIQYSRGQVQEAVRDLKAALRGDWNDPDTLGLLANCYLISGSVDAARPIIDRLLAVDPLTPLSRCMPGYAALLEGRPAAALGSYREMFEMDPANPMSRLFYVYALAANGEAREAGKVADGIPAEVARSAPAQIARLIARALAADATVAKAQLSPEVEAVSSATDVFPRFLAQAFALVGADERALHWLEVAVDRGFVNYPFLAEHDPTLSGLRDHPGFADLMETVRERWQAFEP